MAWLTLLAKLGGGSILGGFLGGSAAVRLAIGVALLTVAAIASGKVAFIRRPKWVTAPAVVLAVEPVRDPPDPRWRIRFAYFDRHGTAHESADEVGSSTWKAGDECLAVFQPAQPGSATLRPLPAGAERRPMSL